MGEQQKQQPGKPQQPQQQQVARGSISLERAAARFTKGEPIGCGAVKRVYKAFDEEEGMEVAWNEVYCTEGCLRDKETQRRMFAEINILQKLKHKNILRLLEWWHDSAKGVLVFITELVCDGSLRTYIRKHRHHPLGDHVIRRYAWQILQGLVYLHGHYPPIIHRDLKCDNILVNGSTGTLKIGDLGFATLQRGVGCLLSVIGTPEFMAPELYEEAYDEKVDIYSFGMCLLEMATHEYPYIECTNPAQIYRRVTQGIQPAGLDNVKDPVLRGFITTCIATDPAQRPEARRLLNHPLFDGVRNCLNNPGRAAAPVPASAAPAAAANAANGAPAAAPAAAPGTAISAGSARSGSPTVSPSLSPTSSVSSDEEGSANGGSATSANAPQPAAAAAVAPVTVDAAAAKAASAGSSVAISMPRLAADRADSASSPFARQLGGSRSLQERQSSMGDRAVPAARSLSACTANGIALSGGWRGIGDALVATGSPGSAGHALQQLAQQGSARQPSLESSVCSIDAPGSVDTAHHQHQQHKGQQSAPSSVDDDMDERDVLFENGTQLDQDTSEPDEAEGTVANLHNNRQQPKRSAAARSTAAAAADAVAAGVGKGEQQPVTVLPSISEDAALEGGDGLLAAGFGGAATDDGREAVSCMCRRVASRQLSFDVGFVNLSGLTRRVGFQFDVGQDTAETIAAEMLENLSLRPEQADEIAVKIRDALESMGVHIDDSETEDTDDFGAGSVVTASLTNSGQLHASLTNSFSHAAGTLHGSLGPAARGASPSWGGSGHSSGVLLDGAFAATGMGDEPSSVLAGSGGSGDVAKSATEATVALIRTLSQQLQLQHLVGRGDDGASPVPPSPSARTEQQLPGLPPDWRAFLKAEDKGAAGRGAHDSNAPVKPAPAAVQQ